MARILWIILVVVLAVWIIGFLMDVAGGLIHLLLIVAAIILIVNLISGRKGV
ncbi:lmo0937 family membrane protein [Planococcus sp. X10-3]|uniref:lmo0937 family membrane protein n=1 Tax=Planococcus sp. X10-3 TaxID=3061240 RepID=UPI003BAF5F15